MMMPYANTIGMETIKKAVLICHLSVDVCVFSFPSFIDLLYQFESFVAYYLLR